MEIKVMKKVLAANDAWADEIRKWLAKKKTTLINLIGSPGAGKTCLLEKTIDMLQPEISIGVIEGDIATTRDAQRIQAKQVPVYQINTGTACHLDANLVYTALTELTPDAAVPSLVVVENIGNLVCPAEFDIGEQAKVAVLSVTEGDDKIEKYPLLFSEARVLVLTKKSLLSMTNFNVERAVTAFRILNPLAPVFIVDSLSGEGCEPWFQWVRNLVRTTTETTDQAYAATTH